MLRLAFVANWCYGYPPYKWQNILFTIGTKCSWKNMAWLTCFNRIKICQCYAIPLNDDTKLIYECFIVKSQHRWQMSVCEVFEIIRSGGYLIMNFFLEKPRTSNYGKKSRNHLILKCSSNVTMDNEFIIFWDKFLKHFSLEFQQLNWFCQIFDA